MATTMKLIARQTLGSSSASVTFSDIPQTGYTDLLLCYTARNDRSGAFGDGVYISLNGSTANFSGRFIQAFGSSVSSGTDGRYVGTMASTSATANTFGSGEIYIPNYAGSTNKSLSATGVDLGQTVIVASANLWSNAAAITSIGLAPSLAPNFVSGSSFFLYGITKA